MILKFTALASVFFLPSIVSNWNSFDVKDWYDQGVIYSGYLALAYMCFAVLLSSRFAWVEKMVKGLDKGYKLHKHLGIASMLALISHWSILEADDFILGAKPEGYENMQGSVGFDWEELASVLGEYSLYLLLAIGAISLIQTISYTKFKFTHKFAGAILIASIIHSVMFVFLENVSLPVIFAVIFLSAIGIYCSILSLVKRIGKENKSQGQITEVKMHSYQGKASVVRFSAQLERPIKYKEGQFAYLNFNDGEEPHPFSILHYDNESQTIEFAIKALGDYTNQLVRKLKKEQSITVEGGYGAFQITDGKEQVWVGAGIGIVPFLSRLHRLKSLKNSEKFKKIHLFYCVNSEQEAFFKAEILALIEELDFIELEMVVAENNQILDSTQIANTMKTESFEVSFCGSLPFGQAIKKGLVAAGLLNIDFHQEEFKMR